MPAPNLITLFVAPLERAGLQTYMISGSVAAIEYGELRATLGVDIALSLSQKDAAALLSIYPASDYYYCPPGEVLAVEIKRPARGHFNVIHGRYGLKADFYPSTTHPLFAWALSNRRMVSIQGQGVWLAPPEYLILWKLEFYREGKDSKHLRDISGMLAVSPQEIDRAIVEKAYASLGLTREGRLCSESGYDVVDEDA